MEPESDLVEQFDGFLRIILQSKSSEVAIWTKIDLTNAIKWADYIEKVEICLTPQIGGQYNRDDLFTIAQTAQDLVKEKGHFNLPTKAFLEPRKFLLGCLVNNPAVTPLLLELIGELDKEVPALVSRQARFLSELAQLREAATDVGLEGGLVAVCAEHLRLEWESLAAEKSPQLGELEAYLLSSAHVEPNLAAVLLRCLHPGSQHIESFLLEHEADLPLFQLPPKLLAEACTGSKAFLRAYCIHLENKVSGIGKYIQSAPFVARTLAEECHASLRPLADRGLISGDFPALHEFLRTWCP